MRHRRLLFFLIAFVLGAILARPVLSSPHSQQPNPAVGDGHPTDSDVVTYTTADGLSDDRIWTIAVGADGRVWFGAYDHGISIFDGQNWSRYTASDGLADNDVRAILMAPNDHIWFGTGQGISRFDGQNWRIFRTIDGLASNGVEALAIDTAGRVWAAHLAEGVSYFDGTNWTTFTVADGLADNWVHDVAIDPAGQVWFGTNGGISVFDGQTWRSFTVADGLVDDTVFALTVDTAGHIWAGTTGGLGRYDGERWQTHLPGKSINDLTVDSSGAIWAVGGGSVNRFDGQQWADYTPANLSGQDIRAVATDSAGQVWIGTFGRGVSRLTFSVAPPLERVWAGTTAGVSVFDGQRWQSYTTADGLVDSEVRAIAIDPRGRKWFGTAGGVSAFDGQQWITYQPLTNSLVSNFVHTVAIDPANRAWFGYGERGQGVTVFDAQTWTTYTTADGLADNHVYAIAFAPDGAAWFGTAAGATHFDGQNWTTYTAANGLLDNGVRTIAVGPDGSVWFGTAQGVSRFNGDQWQTYTAADGLVAGPVNAIALDAQGQVWVGTEPVSPGDGSGGLSRFDGQSWITYPVQRSYLDNTAGLQGDWVTSIALDAAGQPWVGTLAHPLSKPLWVRGGLSTFDGQHWHNYSGDVGLVSNYTTSVAIDATGARWAGSTQGLFRFDSGPPPVRYTTQNGLPADEVRDVAIDRAGRIWAATWGGGAAVLDGERWTTYSTTGLADREINAIAIDRDGNTWFATPGGVSRFDGENWTAYTRANGLLENQANAIVVDPAGHIWVGVGSGGYFGGGVSRFDGQTWISYTTAEGLPRNNVSALAVDDAGDVWAVSYTPGEYTSLSNLARFDGQQWTAPAVQANGLADDHVYSFVVDSQGLHWFGTDGSYSSGPLVTFDGQGWRAYTAADGLPAQQVKAIALDSGGRKWLGTDKGVTVFDGQTWSNYTTTDGLAGDSVLAMAIEESGGEALDLAATWTVLSELGDTFTRLAAASTGSVWAVNATQLLQIDAETVYEFDLPADLRDRIAANPSRAFPTITNLVAAGDGTVWIGARENGLYRFAGDTWQHYTSADGLPAQTPLRLALDLQNRLWAVFVENDAYSLAYFDGQRWQTHPLPDITSAPTGLAVTPGGQVWLAVPGRAPFLFEDSRWQQPAAGWQAGSVDMFLAASPEGTVWFGSDNGWQRWTGQSWQALEVTIPAPFSFPAAVDATGGAWGIVTPFCYWCKLPNLNENGAVYVTPEQSCRFTAADGLGDPPLNPTPYAFDPEIDRPDVVKDIAIAADGRVWFITQGEITVFNPQNSVCDYTAPENVRLPE